MPAKKPLATKPLSMPPVPAGSPWIDGFLFVGNHPALDLLNTRPALDGQPTELLTDFPRLLRWFQAAGLMNPHQARSFQNKWENSPEGRHEVDQLQTFREKFRKAVVTWEDTGNVREGMIPLLNRMLAGSPMLERLSPMVHEPDLARTPQPRCLILERWFDPQRPSDLMAPIAFFAAQLFAETDPTRVRQCDHCVLHFLDTSKKGTRRWCSMQLCGNRFKVAAYAQRQREQQD